MTKDQAHLQFLIDSAIEIAQKAYAPYSRYRVGAALQTLDGEVYAGCNIENASYPAGICAERAALAKAISELPDERRQFIRLVVATKNGGSPCGICRQMLYEFAPSLNVVLVDFDGVIKWDGRLDTLLPLGFGPSNL